MHIAKLRIHRMLLTCGLLVGACGMTTCGSTPDIPDVTPTPLDIATLGRITGIVRFDGEPPKRVPLAMDLNGVCRTAHEGTVYSEKILVRDGRLENVLVTIREGLEDRVFPIPADTVLLDQRGCLFIPHVLALQTWQVLEVRNNDPVLHNVRAVPHHNPSFNVGMMTFGAPHRMRFPEPETGINIRCDVHTWMGAWMTVLAHPYFQVTGADGGFALENVPPGEYVLEAWHEHYPPQSLTVTLPPNGAPTVTFTFQAE